MKTDPRPNASEDRDESSHIPVLQDRAITLGVSGSIAVYKALILASRLTQAGAQVDVVMTRAATELVRPLAFQALTHRPVVHDLWEAGSEIAMDHVATAHRSSALLVAPATADRIAQLALGLAGDALGTTALATRAPLLLAPAMEPNMWAHPATQGHVETLLQRGARFVGPEEGRMASGKMGRGRMAEPERIIDALRHVLGLGVEGGLRGRRVLVGTGPTREALDPVRFLSNHASGSIGFALARAARDRGASVTLVTGPARFDSPEGVETIRVETALEMQAALHSRLRECDALIMSAAVGDYRATEISESKLKKSEGPMRLELVRNPDILLGLDEELRSMTPTERPIRVGFAAETESLVANARDKLRRKGLDLVVANTVPAAFGAGLHQVTLVSADGEAELQPMYKPQVAERILDRVERLLERD